MKKLVSQLNLIVRLSKIFHLDMMKSLNILNQINITIKKGDKIAIKIRTGSTTLINNLWVIRSD